MINLKAVSQIYSKVYVFSLPEETPATRMFLTRMLGIGCLFFEVTAIITTSASLIKHSFSDFKASDLKASDLKASDLKASVSQICRLVAGVFFTIIFGIALSPAFNYRIHCWLTLTVDDFLIHQQAKTEKSLARQIELEKAEALKKTLEARLEKELLERA